MLIYFGADHRGFNLKEYLKDFVKNEGYEIFDMGAKAVDKDDDYPDYARLVGEKITMDPDGCRGILICGSGAGMDIAANKIPRVRAALGMNPDQVMSARHDDNANVLVLAADFTPEDIAAKITKVFLSTPFAGEERFQRRIDKIGEIERGTR